MSTMNTTKSILGRGLLADFGGGSGKVPVVRLNTKHTQTKQKHTGFNKMLASGWPVAKKEEGRRGEWCYT